MLNDPDAYAAALNDIRADVEDVLNGLAPEDALVSFDSVEIEYMSGQPDTLGDTFQGGSGAAQRQDRNGCQNDAAVLGHTTTSNAASAETMLYLKHADFDPAQA